MDWRACLQSLVQDTQHNLASLPNPHGGYGDQWSGKKAASSSYALLRHGISPGDPHLIAPALPDHQLIPPYRPDGEMPAGADWRQHQQRQEEAVGQLKAELQGLGDQLLLLRQSASSWQQVAAAVTGVDSRCAANTSQLAALGAGVAEVRAAQGQLQEASSKQHQEVQGCLAALGGRLDAVAGLQGPEADAAALQVLDSRLERAEQGLEGLQSRLDQQAPALAADIAPAVAAAAAAAVAGVRAELAAVQGVQRSTAQRQEAQQAQQGSMQSELQAMQGSHGRLEGQLDAQQAWLGTQLAELQAAQRGGAQQHAGQVERLGAQLAQMAARVEEHARQLQQQQEHGQRQPAPGTPQAAQVAGAQAEQAEQLAAVQAAVDDINQRLFELRVEVQNATEDSASEAAATKRQAEAAERQAADAVGAVADLRQLAASLEQQMASLQQQTTAIAAVEGSGLVKEEGAAAANGSGASLALTADQVVAELAGMKLLLAQQQEAAEGAAAASRAEAATREEQVAYVQAALAALDYRLQRHGSQGGQADGGSSSAQETAVHAAETAACLATLTDIVHRQREELESVKQGVVAAQAATAAAAGAGAADGQRQGERAAQEGAAGSEAAGAASSGQLEALQARIDSLEAALAEDRASAAAALAAQQQHQGTWQALAAMQQQVEGLQQQLGALAAATAAGQQVQGDEGQRGKQGMEQGLGLPRAARQEVESRMSRTEVTVATALEEVAAQMAALMARMDRAEVSSLAAATHAQAAAAVAQQQAEALQGLLSPPLSCQPSGSGQASSGLQQAAAGLPAGAPLAGSISLSRQASLQRWQSQSQQGESLPQSPRHHAGAAAAQASTGAVRGGSGLFARLSRSFGSQPRGSFGSCSCGSDGGSQDSAAAAAGASEGGEVRSNRAEVPLRAQYSSTEGCAGPSRDRSRRASTSSGGGGGSGAGTPGGSAGTAAAAQHQRQRQADSPLYTPRSRHSPGNWVAAAALQQERSGASSAGASPRQGLPASGFSSFGELPLPQGSSYLVSPREGVEEQIQALEAELAQGASDLDDVQREVLQSDLQRLGERLERAAATAAAATPRC